MKHRTPTSKDAARSSERRLNSNEPDAFPPEGTDESTLHRRGGQPLSEKDRLKATRGFIKLRDDAVRNQTITSSSE